DTFTFKGRISNNPAPFDRKPTTLAVFDGTIACDNGDREVCSRNSASLAGKWVQESLTSCELAENQASKDCELMADVSGINEVTVLYGYSDGWPVFGAIYGTLTNVEACGEEASIEPPDVIPVPTPVPTPRPTPVPGQKKVIHKGRNTDFCGYKITLNDVASGSNTAFFEIVDPSGQTHMFSPNYDDVHSIEENEVKKVISELTLLIKPDTWNSLSTAELWLVYDGECGNRPPVPGEKVLINLGETIEHSGYNITLTKVRSDKRVAYYFIVTPSGWEYDFSPIYEYIYSNPDELITREIGDLTLIVDYDTQHYGDAAELWLIFEDDSIETTPEPTAVPTPEPTAVPTARPESTPEPTPVPSEAPSKRSNGSPCTASDQCHSGNCDNGACCVEGMECCFSTTDCPPGNVCSDRHYCVEDAVIDDEDLEIIDDALEVPDISDDDLEIPDIPEDDLEIPDLLPEPTRPPSTPQVSDIGKPTPQPPGKKVTIVEYMDPLRIGETLKEIRITRIMYRNVITYEFKPLPDAADPLSLKATEAYLCAKDQGQGDELLQGLAGKIEIDHVAAIADLALLVVPDADTFIRCFESGSKEFEVARLVIDAEKAGISKTPKFMVTIDDQIAAITHGITSTRSVIELLRNEIGPPRPDSEMLKALDRINGIGFQRLATPTPPPLEEVVQRPNGQRCYSNEECFSSNCGTVCCLQGKTCCRSNADCHEDKICNRERYYCVDAGPTTATGRMRKETTSIDKELMRREECGDGLCDHRFEDLYNCPDDCRPPRNEKEYIETCDLLVRTDNTGLLNMTGPINSPKGFSFDVTADLQSDFAIESDGWAPLEERIGRADLFYSSDGKRMSYEFNASLNLIPDDPYARRMFFPFPSFWFDVNATTTRSSVDITGATAFANPGEMPDITLALEVKEGTLTVELASPEIPGAPAEMMLEDMNKQFLRQGVATQVERYIAKDGYIEVDLINWPDIFVSEAKAEVREELATALQALEFKLDFYTVQEVGTVRASLTLEAQNLDKVIEPIMKLADAPSGIPILREGSTSFFIIVNDTVEVRGIGSFEHVDYDVSSVGASLRRSCLKSCEESKVQRRRYRDSGVSSMLAELATGTECTARCVLISDIVTSALRIDMTYLSFSTGPRSSGQEFKFGAKGANIDPLIGNLTLAVNMEAPYHIPRPLSGTLSIYAQRLSATVELADLMEESNKVFLLSGPILGRTTTIKFEDSAIATFDTVEPDPEPDERSGNKLTWIDKEKLPYSVESTVKVDTKRLELAHEVAINQLAAIEKLSLSGESAVVFERSKGLLEEAERMMAEGNVERAMQLVEQSASLIRTLPDVETGNMLRLYATAGSVVMGVVLLAVVLASRWVTELQPDPYEGYYEQGGSEGYTGEGYAQSGGWEGASSQAGWGDQGQGQSWGEQEQSQGWGEQEPAWNQQAMDYSDVSDDNQWDF
ncbi:MAG: hypothetical protein QGG26_14685, partial [Candidatus Undinarchaeales archaeon]|nr:hypothetical protein [Candidatus Undinarchaeales archaeon]